MAIKLFTLAQVTVTTTGTRVQVSTSDLAVTSVVIQAAPANTGNIYVGDDAVTSTRNSATLEPSRAWSISADGSGRAGQEEFVLSDFWVDSATSGDKVNVSYIKRR